MVFFALPHTGSGFHFEHLYCDFHINMEICHVCHVAPLKETSDTFVDENPVLNREPQLERQYLKL